MEDRNYTSAEMDRLSRALLRLHKRLLDGERAAYEQMHGPIASNGAFLQLLLGHEWFAWLRQLSGLMAALDELAESKDPNACDAIVEPMASLRRLLMPSETGGDFGRKYYKALQRDPDAVLMHETVKELLK
jgi:hypothetical protein